MDIVLPIDPSSGRYLIYSINNFMKITELSNITAYHYSDNRLKIGDRIYSHQSTGKTFNLVWSLYKIIADELGIYFPKDYGYAYPSNHLENVTSLNLYTVSAPSNSVTSGNYNYSLYVTMAALGQLTDKTIKDMDRRILTRNRVIKERAKLYFLAKENIELISDLWIVVATVKTSRPLKK